MNETRGSKLPFNHQPTYIETRHLTSLTHDTQSYSHCNLRYQTGLLIKTDTKYACILSRTPINEYFIHRFITRNNPRNQIIYFRRKESCSSAYTATQRHFPHSNKFRLTGKLSDKRQWSLEPLQRRWITPNSAETHPKLLHDPYTGNQAVKRTRLSSTILKIKSE